MKRLIILLFIITSVFLSLIGYFYADSLTSVSILSVFPFAFFFISFTSAIAGIRFKDEEDGKLSREECSLPIREVARIRRTSGSAYFIGCVSEAFLIFFVGGILKLLSALAAFILSFIFSRIIYAYELRRALEKVDK